MKKMDHLLKSQFTLRSQQPYLSPTLRQMVLCWMCSQTRTVIASSLVTIRRQRCKLHYDQLQRRLTDSLSALTIIKTPNLWLRLSQTKLLLPDKVNHRKLGFLIHSILSWLNTAGHQDLISTLLLIWSSLPTMRTVSTKLPRSTTTAYQHGNTK